MILDGTGGGLGAAAPRRVASAGARRPAARGQRGGAEFAEKRNITTRRRGVRGDGERVQRGGWADGEG